MTTAKEYKLTPLRECPLPEEMQHGDTPEKIVYYWHEHVTKHPVFNPSVECFVEILLNTRRRIIGHLLVSMGTMDTLLVHPREVFKPAIVANASAIVVCHNHPSGESNPSEADIKVTRDLMKAGQLLKIELLDHIVIGRGEHKSLRSLGYFYS